LRPSPSAPGTTAGRLTAAEYSLKENYTKYEYRIPMRDGKLFTAVLRPRTSEDLSVLMERTPQRGAVRRRFLLRQIGPSTDFPKAGYIFVIQDVRGRYMSEGKFIEMTPHKPNKKAGEFDESTDMFDTVEWLLKNVPNHNGKVGIWGISYPGFFVSASIIDSHPAIKAASPQAPVTDLYMNDDSYHNGAFMLAANYGFYSSFKQQDNPAKPPKRWEEFDYGTADGYEYFLRLGTLPNIIKTLEKQKGSLFLDQAGRDTYEEYWKSRNIGAHLKNVKAAVLTVGGWFDAEDPQGPLAVYQSIKKNNPGTFNSLVMGPWTHGGWAGNDGAAIGRVSFGPKTGDYFRKNILLPFFEKFLKDGKEAKDGKGDGKPETKLAEAYAFETGTNIWRQYSSWAAGGSEPAHAVFPRQGQAVVDRALRVRRFRRIHQRPGQAGAVHQRHLDRRAAGIHGRRPALRRHPHRCAGVPDRGAGGRRDHRRPAVATPVCLHQRHRFRFRRQADRRLSGRVPGGAGTRAGRRRRAARSAAGALRHGRLPAAGARRADARQVPQQF
jgi:hypothetical protein